MNIWIAAWIFSIVSSGGVYLFARRSNLPQADSLILAAAAFPAPLLRLVNSHNSLLYGLDVATPFAVYYAHLSWAKSHPRVRTAAAALTISAGLLPLVIAAIFSHESYDLMITGTNLYRLVGVSALLVRFNAQRQKIIEFGGWLSIFAWISIVILCAMLAKLALGIDTDVISWVDGVAGNYREGDEARLNVLGLFRGSIGFFGVFSVCAYAANRKTSLRSQAFSLVGAIAGLLIIILIGSKTSLLVVTAVVLVSLMRIGIRQISIGAVLILTIMAFVVTVDTAAYRQMLPRTLVALVESNGTSHETADSRADIWRGCLDALANSPSIILGAATPRAMPTSITTVSTYLPVYFHNEYLAIVMLGGIYSLIGYILCLYILMHLLLARRRKSCTERFALFVFWAGLVEAWTVGHLQPNLLFCTTASMSAAIYGLACPNVLSTKASARLMSIRLSSRSIE